jgi:hypothetical protein
MSQVRVRLYCKSWGNRPRADAWLCLEMCSNTLHHHLYASTDNNGMAYFETNNAQGAHCNIWLGQSKLWAGVMIGEEVEVWG